MAVWFVMDVDTEFDNERIGRPYSPYNPGIEKGVGLFLDIFKKYDVPATFHIQEQKNPEHSVSLKYPAIIERIMKNGHEIGLHTHFGSHHYNHRCEELTAAHNRLEQVCGRVASFRAGNYFTNEATIKILSDLKIENDVSPWKNTSIATKRWYKIPDSPYHPDPSDITKEGNHGTLIIPITDTRLAIILEEQIPLEAMIRGTKFLISLSKKISQPVIVFLTTHSWKLVDPRTGQLRKNIIDKLGGYLLFIKNNDINCMTIKELGRKWREGGCHSYVFENRQDVLRDYLPLFSIRRHLSLLKLLSWLKYPQYYFFGRL